MSKTTAGNHGQGAFFNVHDLVDSELNRAGSVYDIINRARAFGTVTKKPLSLTHIMDKFAR